MSEQPYMVEQVIKYSDGSETSIKYRGVIVGGVLQNEEVKEVQEESKEAKPVRFKRLKKLLKR